MPGSSRRSFPRSALLAPAVAALLGGGHALRAQSPPQVFRAEVEVVALDIAVVDANGRPVRGLGPADFELTVDGRPRPVVSAEFVAATEDEEGRAAASPPPAHFTSNEGRPPGRLVVIAVDQGNIAAGAGREAIRAAGQLLDRLGTADKVGLLTVPGPEPREELTSDHGRVREALGRIAGRALTLSRRISVSEALAYDEQDDPERWRAAVQRVCPVGTTVCVRDLQAEATRVAWDYRDRSRRAMAMLRSTFDVMAGLEGQKVVVLVTQGLGQPDGGSRPGRTTHELHELGDAAARSRVAFFVVQVKPEIGVGAESALPLDLVADDRLLQEDSLTALTVLARGAVLRGDPVLAFERVAREISGYYLLGFEPERSDRDGKAHDVVVRVRRPGMTVRNRRQVAFPPAMDAKSEERALVAALRAPLAATGIPLRVATYAVQGAAPGKVRVLISAEIGRAAQAGGTSVAWVLLDGRGRTAASRVRRETDEGGTPAGPASFTDAANVDPGLYTLRIAVRDRAGRQGSLDHPVKAALVDAGRLRLSDLMLGLPPARGAGLKPGLGLHGDGDPLLAHLELYGDARDARVSFEIAHDETAATLFALPARIATVAGRGVAQALIPTSGLAPGDYVVRAAVGLGGTAVAAPAHPFRVKGS